MSLFESLSKPRFPRRKSSYLMLLLSSIMNLSNDIVFNKGFIEQYRSTINAPRRLIFRWSSSSNLLVNVHIASHNTVLIQVETGSHRVSASGVNTAGFKLIILFDIIKKNIACYFLNWAVLLSYINLSYERLKWNALHVKKYRNICVFFIIPVYDRCLCRSSQ